MGSVGVSLSNLARTSNEFKRSRTVLRLKKCCSWVSGSGRFQVQVAAFRGSEFRLFRDSRVLGIVGAGILTDILAPCFL